MVIAHNVVVSVFCKTEEEDEQKVLDKLLALCPFKIEKQLSISNATGFNEQKIKIFEINVTRQKEVRLFLDWLIGNIDQKELILNQAESRIDDGLNFFLRIDKDKWINESKIRITDSGKCFHVKIKLATYPKNKGVALDIIRNLFK